MEMVGVAQSSNNSALPCTIMHQAVSNPLPKCQTSTERCFCPGQRQRLLAQPVMGCTS